MKILQINKFFFLRGGAERHFFNLAELLSQKGHQVIAWSTQHKNNFPWPDSDSFAQYSDFSKSEELFKDLKKVLRIFWNKEAKDKLEKIIQKEKPDVAHLYNIFTHFSPSIIYLLKKYNIPIILNLHDYKLFCPNYQFFSQGKPCFDCLEKKNYSSCLDKKCIKNSWIKSLVGYLEGKWQKDFLKIADKIDLFIAPSLYIKKKALTWGLPAKKIIHLPHFVNNEESNKEFDSQKYILYFGRLSKEKGIDLLIKSYIENQTKLAKWKLKIMGQGPERKELEKLAENYPQIKFINKKNGSELRNIISQAYLIVVPSIWPDNLPHSISESQILAKPVLASKIGGIPEMIKDKETGLLFKPNNLIDLIRKINWAVNNPGKLKKIGKNARQQILENRNQENYAQKIIKIYERIKNN